MLFSRGDTGIGAVVFFWRAFTAREPVVDLRAFADKNFTMGCIFSFTMGIGPLRA